MVIQNQIIKSQILVYVIWNIRPLSILFIGQRSEEIDSLLLQINYRMRERTDATFRFQIEIHTNGFFHINHIELGIS